MLNHKPYIIESDAESDDAKKNNGIMHRVLEIAMHDDNSAYSCDNLVDDLKDLLIKIGESNLPADQAEEMINAFYSNHGLQGTTSASLINAMLYGIQTHCCLTEAALIKIKDNIANESHQSNSIKPEVIASVEYMADFHPIFVEICNDQIIDSEIYRKTKISTEILDLWHRDEIYRIKSKEDILKNFDKYYEMIGCDNFGDDSIPTIEDLGEDDEEHHNSELVTASKKNNSELEKKIFSRDKYCKIDISSSISKEIQKIFQQCYGKTWKDMVNMIIKDIENKVVMNMMFKSFDPNHKCIFDNEDLSYHSQIENNSCANKYSILKDSNMLLLKKDSEIMEKTLEIFNKSMKEHLEKIGKAVSGKIIEVGRNKKLLK
jgi:DNA-binding protein Fis